MHRVAPRLEDEPGPPQPLSRADQDRPVAAAPKPSLEPATSAAPLAGELRAPKAADSPDERVRTLVREARAHSPVEDFRERPLAGLRRRLDEVMRSPGGGSDAGVLETVTMAVEGWAPAAETWAATGKGYDAPVGLMPSIAEHFESSDQEPARQLAKMQVEAELIADGHAKARKKALLESPKFADARAGARLRELGEGKLGPSPRTVIELRHDADGTVAGLSVARASTLPEFDAWVLERVRQSLPSLPLEPRAKPYRSRWLFVGRVSFMRAATTPGGVGDIPYFLAALSTNLATGRFDETTGTVEVVDLQHPHFECEVRAEGIEEDSP